jgi:Putative Actinobacterial Holin-X, holin superfamily III
MTQACEVESAPRSLSDAASDERPVGAIVNDILEKAEKLVRQEMRLGLTEAEEKVDLLKHELDERLDILKREAAAKAIGGTIAFAGILAVVAGIVLLLAKVMNPWLAAFLTGAALSVVGVVLLKREVKLPAPPSAAEFIPKRTIENIKADTRAIEEASHGTK